MAKNSMDQDLEATLAAARAVPEMAPDDLMARIIADADQVQAERAEAMSRPANAQAGWWSSITQTLGGWPSFAAIAASAFFGVGIGYATTPNLQIDTAELGSEDALFGSDNALFSMDDLDSEV